MPYTVAFDITNQATYLSCSGDRGGSGGYGKSDRGGGGSSYGGGRSDSYGGQGDMEVQQDTIFVSGMGEDCSEEGMVQHFGSIGVIKVKN